MRLRVRPSLEMRQRILEWLKEPLPEEPKAFEDAIRDLDDILTGRRPEQGEAAE